MTRFQWLAVTAGIAALAACKGGDDVNMTNIEVNAADENLALPPVDMNDTNMTNDTNGTDNTANNTSDNTVNAY